MIGKKTIPDAIKHGQFTHSYSQIALTNLFNHIDPFKEILIFSGHNPDFHRQIGIGWWEDSPNIVKYAIAKDLSFLRLPLLSLFFVTMPQTLMNTNLETKIIIFCMKHSHISHEGSR